MKKFILISLLSFTVSFLAEAAPAVHSKIQCHNRGAHGQEVTTTFESLDGVDLTNPSGKSVLLSVNGEPEPVEFEVSQTKTILGMDVDYFHRNPFFISDIAIRVQNSATSNVPLVSGSWTVDHPPVLNLTCHFLN